MMRPIDVQHYEQQHRSGTTHVVQRQYGEHLARLRAQAARRRQTALAELFEDGQDHRGRDEIADEMARPDK